MDSNFELDADFENDLLEWSEDHNISNESLLSLFQIIKSHIKNIKNDLTQKHQSKDSSSDSESNLAKRLKSLEKGQKYLVCEISKLANTNPDIQKNDYQTNKTKNARTSRNSRDDFENEDYETIEVYVNNDDIDILSLLPCKSIEEIRKFETVCKSNLFLEEKLRNIFLAAKDEDVTAFIDENIKVILFEDLLSSVSWSGIGKRVAIKNLFPIKILLEVTIEKFNFIRDEAIVIFQKWDDPFQKSINLKRNVKTTIEMEFLDPLSSDFNEEYQHFDKIDIFSNLPCNTVKQYENLQIALEECEKHQSDLMDFFKKTKNLDYKTFLDSIMKQLMADNVAISLKFTKVKDHLTTTLIKATVLETFPYVSEFDFYDTIKSFFCKAQDRHRKKICRERLSMKFENVARNDQEDDYEDIDDGVLFESISVLPCSTYKQLLKFEKSFKANEFLRNQVKEFFLQEGEVKSPKLFIHANFRKLIEDKVTFDCMWGTGFTSSSIKSFSVIQLLRECTHEMFPHITTDLINDDMRLFLYRTKDRVKRKLEKGTACHNVKLRRYNKIDVKLDEEPQSFLGIRYKLNFPLKTVEDFENFERKCHNNEELQEKLEFFYNKLKNCHYLTFIDSNMRKLLSDNVSGAFTWHGRQGNIAAKDFFCINLLKTCVENIYPNLSEKEIVESFMKIFRRAKERNCHLKRSHFIDLEDKNSKKSEKSESEDGDDDEEEEDILSILPCKSVEEFKSFERNCRNNFILQTNLRNMFDSYSDVDPKKFVTENIRKMMPDNVASRFSFAGQQSNISLQHFVTINILRESVRARYNLIDDMIVTLLKKCLHMVKDRVRVHKNSGKFKYF